MIIYSYLQLLTTPILCLLISEQVTSNPCQQSMNNVMTLISASICLLQLVLVLIGVCPPLFPLHPKQAAIACLPSLCCPDVSDCDLVHLTPHLLTCTSNLRTDIRSMDSTAMMWRQQYFSFHARPCITLNKILRQNDA